MNPILNAVMGIIGGPLDGLLSRFFPSKEKAQEFQAELQKMLVEQEGEITKAAIAVQQGQIEVNKVEASVPTAGTGFVATGAVTDNSTYNFVILEVN